MAVAKKAPKGGAARARARSGEVATLSPKQAARMRMTGGLSAKSGGRGGKSGGGIGGG